MPTPSIFPSTAHWRSCQGSTLRLREKLQSGAIFKKGEQLVIPKIQSLSMGTIEHCTAFEILKSCSSKKSRTHISPDLCVGPSLSCNRSDENCLSEQSLDDPLEFAINSLSAGDFVAIKGVCGCHLMVDAENDRAVARLRVRKQRPHKPFAVMFPGPGEPEAGHNALSPHFAQTGR